MRLWRVGLEPSLSVINLGILESGAEVLEIRYHRDFAFVAPCWVVCIRFRRRRWHVGQVSRRLIRPPSSVIIKTSQIQFAARVARSVENAIEQNHPASDVWSKG